MFTPYRHWLQQQCNAVKALEDQRRALVDTLRNSGHIVIEQGDEIFVKPIKGRD